jgi:hypothetical protein
MITGRKTGESAAGIRRSYAWLGLLLAVAVGVFAVGYPAVQGPAPGDRAAAQHEEEEG